MKKVEYIPIGMYCKIAVTLRKKGLRNNAYPFDWMLTPMESVYKLCKHGFDGFLNDIWMGEKVHQVYVNDRDAGYDRIEDYIYPVIDTTYNINLPHSYRGKDQESINKVRKTFERRINRFYHTISNTDIQKKFVYQFSSPNEGQIKWYQESGAINFKSSFVHKNSEIYLDKIKDYFSSTYDNVEFIELDNVR